MATQSRSGLPRPTPITQPSHNSEHSVDDYNPVKLGFHGPNTDATVVQHNIAGLALAGRTLICRPSQFAGHSLAYFLASSLPHSSFAPLILPAARYASSAPWPGTRRSGREQLPVALRRMYPATWWRQERVLLLCLSSQQPPEYALYKSNPLAVATKISTIV